MRPRALTRRASSIETIPCFDEELEVCYNESDYPNFLPTVAPVLSPQQIQEHFSDDDIKKDEDVVDCESDDNDHVEKEQSRTIGSLPRCLIQLNFLFVGAQRNAPLYRVPLKEGIYGISTMLCCELL